MASSPTAIRRVACIGAGTIGASWAAYFLSRGLEVVVSDPAPGAPDLLRRMIENHRRYTGSAQAELILDNWETHFPLFVKVMPIDYRKALEKMRQYEQVRSEQIPATEEVYRI